MAILLDNLAECFKIITINPENDIIVGIEHCEKSFYDVLFHHEVNFGVNGMKIFDNFIKISNVKQNLEFKNELKQN